MHTEDKVVADLEYVQTLLILPIMLPTRRIDFGKLVEFQGRGPLEP